MLIIITTTTSSSIGTKPVNKYLPSTFYCAQHSANIINKLCKLKEFTM